MQPITRGAAPTNPIRTRTRGSARRAGAAIGAGLLAATTFTLLPAAPAGATTVGDEAGIRAAFADPNETLVTLTTHIDLVDCVAGDLERTSATPLVIEANGFRLRQTCAGEGILRLDGGGGVTADHIHLTGGSPLGSGGGAIESDGPVVVRNGSELSANSAPHGGAIYTSSPQGTVAVLDSLVAVNTTTANGGAIFSDATVELRGSTFADNNSGSHGGVVSTSGAVVVSGSTFQGNEADASGVFQVGTSLTIDSSSFTGNEARESDGGVIQLVDATATISSSSFDLNDAAGNGGAIAAMEDGEGSTIAVIGSTFADNTAAEGGAIYGLGTTTVSSSRFEQNASTSDSGGAIFNDGTLVVDQGSVLAGNTSGRHGGAIAGDGPITISASQITGNEAVHVGGGIAGYDEVTVVDGTDVVANAASQGGGVYADGLVTATDSTFSSNVATGDEGGAIRTGSGAVVTRSTFDSNGALDAGGAIFAFDVPIAVEASTFTNNAAGTHGGAIRTTTGGTVAHSAFAANESGQGGAVASDEALTITGSTFTENGAFAFDGGAVHSEGATVLDQSTFTANVAPSGEGAAVAMGGSSTLDVTASRFDANVAGLGGGALTTDDGITTILESTFEANEAGSSGGAISAEGPLLVERSTLHANTTPDAGGAISAAQVATVFNSTITGNEAGLTGGGIGSEGDVHLVHVTMVDNAAPSGANLAMITPGAGLAITASVLGLGATDDCRLVGVIVDSGGFNRSADQTCGLADPTDVSDATDPVLGDLADNGGSTATRLPADGSPLVDAVPAASCVQELPTDQRAVARPAGDGCDIGAVEVGALPDGTDDPDGSGDSEGTGDPQTPDGDDMTEVMGTVAVDLGAETTGTLPVTGPTSLVVLGAIGAALVAGGRLLLGLARRRRV